MLFEAMIGKTIGNYRITGEIAVGGMGAVYRARHLHLPREVVIKSILLESFSPSSQEQLKARFRREACVQSQLDHHNIVRVYEFFETRDNYYLVMEYVAGVSLRELLDRQGSPTPQQAVYLFKQVLSALDYAHNFSYVDETGVRQSGFIHRDINPANLLLDHRGRVKITDFGTVKVSGNSRLTQHGFHPGTIEYMSPEQLRGAEIDARSDLYSVGVTFYEMLTGQLPFPRSEDGSDWEVRKGHMELTPPSILKLNPEVPAQLVSVVMKSLEKSPDARYRSAAEFIAALRAFKRQSEESGRKAVSRKSRKKTARPANAQGAQAIIKLDRELFADQLNNQFEFDDSITIPVPPSDLTDAQRDKKADYLSSRIRQSGKNTSGNPAKSVLTKAGAARHTSSAITRYNWFLNAALLSLILIGSLIGIFYISSENDRQNLHAAMTEPENTAAMSKAAAGRSALDKAEEMEQRENFNEALEAYESILKQNPNMAGAGDLSLRIAEIRRFQALTEAAKMAANGNRLNAAWQYYSEALQVRPGSSTAKAGLAEIENRMANVQR